MIPLNENDTKKIAMPETIPDLGKVRPYQVEDGAVMVANEHAICRVSNFTALDDGHYYYNHEIEATGQTLSTYFKIRPNPEASISLPLDVVKRLYDELRVWAKGLGRGLFVEFTYSHDDEMETTTLALSAPGETNKIASKNWSYSWERAMNDNYFRAVCNSNQLVLMLSIFSKMKDTENLPVPVKLNYDPQAFDVKESGRPVYNGVWFLDAHYLGHFISAGYSTKSVCTPKDQAEEGGLLTLIEDEEQNLANDEAAQAIRDGGSKKGKRKRRAVAVNDESAPDDGSDEAPEPQDDDSANPGFTRPEAPEPSFIDGNGFEDDDFRLDD